MLVEIGLSSVVTWEPLPAEMVYMDVAYSIEVIRACVAVTTDEAVVWLVLSPSAVDVELVEKNLVFGMTVVEMALRDVLTDVILARQSVTEAAQDVTVYSDVAYTVFVMDSASSVLEASLLVTESAEEAITPSALLVVVRVWLDAAAEFVV